MDDDDPVSVFAVLRQRNRYLSPEEGGAIWPKGLAKEEGSHRVHTVDGTGLAAPLRPLFSRKVSFSEGERLTYVGGPARYIPHP